MPDVPGPTEPTEPTDPDEPPVTQKELTGIEIKTLPTKLTYTVGDTFDATGLQVSAVYDNGDKEDIVADEYNVSSPDMSRSGTVTVTVTYKADISKTATFDITVNGDTITLENDADGDTFNFYLDTSVTSGDNLWIACVGKRIESQLTDGDGIYSDSDLLAPFVNNDNGFNEVMTIIDIELAEKTVLTVRYGGAIDADATLNPACTLGSAADGKFTLPAGTYSFYYNYYTKVMWISGTPDVSQDPNAGFAYDAVTDTLKVYLTGQFAAKDMESFDWDNGYVFATTDNNCYKLDRIYLQEGDIIKVRSGSIGYGYNYIKAKYGEPVQTGGVKDGGGNDRNIIIVNTGYYSIEFWKEYSGDKLISILYSVD